MDYSVLIVSAFFGGLVGAFGFGIFHNYALDRKVVALEARAERIEKSYIGAKGNASQAQANERFEMAVGEALTAIQGGAQPQEVLKEVGKKYPDVALRLVKKYGGIR